MKEYLINSGEFNTIVVPAEKSYFILESDQKCQAIVEDFLEGKQPNYKTLTAHWFKYNSDESWRDFDNNHYQLGNELSESELIDKFVLKKNNFGSLVATRDTESGKVQVFKRAKL
jgi:hypothetical protein